jgi:hypothetical protein
VCTDPSGYVDKCVSTCSYTKNVLSSGVSYILSGNIKSRCAVYGGLVCVVKLMHVVISTLTCVSVVLFWNSPL